MVSATSPGEQAKQAEDLPARLAMRIGYAVARLQAAAIYGVGAPHKEDGANEEG